MVHNLSKSILIGPNIQYSANPVQYEWQKSYTFYDRYGRVIQTQAVDHLNNRSISTNYYDFPGKLLRTVSNYNQGNTVCYKTTKIFGYDHADRLMRTFQQIDIIKNGQVTNGQVVQLFENSYNELGQLIRKDLHAVIPNLQIATVNPSQSAVRTDFLQSVDYTYNIRGWLTDVNNIGNIGTDLFAMRLYYTDDFNYLEADEQYNGNITIVEYLIKRMVP